MQNRMQTAGEKLQTQISMKLYAGTERVEKYAEEISK